MSQSVPDYAHYYKSKDHYFGSDNKSSNISTLKQMNHRDIGKKFERQPFRLEEALKENSNIRLKRNSLDII